MDRLERHRRRLQQRMIASAAIFTAFAIAAGIAGARGTTFEDRTLLVLIVLIIVSFGILPRSAVPSRWPEPQSPEESDRQELMRESLLTIQTRATYQRLFYLAIAFLLIVALPLMGL